MSWRRPNTGFGRRDGFRNAGGQAVAQAPATISDLKVWFRADRGVTLNGSTVSAWADQAALGGAQDMSQGTAAEQPTYVASDADFAGQPSLQFDGTTDKLIAATAADWTFMSNGLGLTVFLVCRVSADVASQLLLDNNNGDVTASNSATGLVLQHQGGANDRFHLVITRSAAGAVVDALTSASSVVAPASGILVFRYLEGRADNEYDLRWNRTSHASGNSTNAPSASAPAGPLCIGAQWFSEGLLFNGDIPELAMYTRYLSDTEVTQLEAYASRYGI